MNDRLPADDGAGAATLARPRLHEALGAGVDTKMTLVIAPAGYGKSVLLRAWADTLESAVAWCALSEHDNDPGRLVRTIVDAIEKVADRPTGPIDHQLAFTAPSTAPALIEEWAEQLTAVGELVLVIDDLHELIDRSAIETAQRFVEAAPSNVHLCIASRHDPPLAVARLRLDGRLTEVRQSDLAFTSGELRSLLAENSIGLDEELLNTLHVRTDGWPAALRLALISMQQTGDAERVVRDLVGTNRIVAEYLLEEVLRDMEPGKHRFLLETSILEDVNDELGEMLTGRLDSGSILEELVAAGEFTTRTSATGWYRYHGLLRDLLRARLRDLDAEQFLRLHREVAHWWWQRGDPAKAINHAITGREIEQATVWLGDAASSMASAGQGATIVELAERISGLTTDPSPLLLMLRMWALYDLGARYPETERLLDTIEELLSNDTDAPGPAGFVHGGDPRAFEGPTALPWLRGLKARTRGDLDGLLTLDRPEVLPSPSGRVEAFIGEGLLWTEQYDDADPLFETFREHARADQFVPSMTFDLGLRAYAALGRGRFEEAGGLVDEAAALIERYGIAHLIHTLYAQLAQAWLHWERGELLECESKLGASQQFVDETGDVPISVQHAILRSCTRWSLGDRDAAHELLDTAAATTGRVVTGHFADRIALARATLDVLENEPDRAAAWIPNWRERLDQPTEPMRSRLVLSRIAIELGRDVDLEEVLDHRHATDLHRIEAARCAAARALSEGRKAEARSLLASLMHDATRLGAIQRVVDEQQALSPIFAEAALDAGFEAGTIVAARIPVSSGGAPRPAWFVEQLTDRELEVLEQLTTQLNHAEIAETLYVSTNTLKTHVKAIFRKLAVSRRTDAVNRAREFGLIPDRSGSRS